MRVRARPAAADINRGGKLARRMYSARGVHLFIRRAGRGTRTTGTIVTYGPARSWPGADSLAGDRPAA